MAVDELSQNVTFHAIDTNTAERHSIKSGMDPGLDSEL